MATKAAKAPAKPKAEKPLSRAERIASVVDGHTFEFAAEGTTKEPFRCICGAKGKFYWRVKDETGAEHKVGTYCLPHVGLEAHHVPKEKPVQRVFAPTRFSTPVRTPKPASGPPVAPQPKAAPTVPEDDIDALLADL